MLEFQHSTEAKSTFKSQPQFKFFNGMYIIFTNFDIFLIIVLTSILIYPVFPSILALFAYVIYCAFIQCP